MYTILVVEDNKDYREDVLEMLEFEGYNAIAAENGEAALLLMQQDIPNLILSDNDMPVMAGVELLQAVKAEPKLQTIPFILVTGHGENHVTQHVRDLGADAVLLKPIVMHELLSLIDKFLKAYPNN